MRRGLINTQVEALSVSGWTAQIVPLIARLTVTSSVPDMTRLGPEVGAGCMLSVLVRNMLLILILQLHCCVQFQFYLPCPLLFPFKPVG